MEGLAAQGTGWTQESDDSVRAALERELARLGGASAHEALGLAPGASDKQLRTAFLLATKRLHPNRFARRAAEIRRLANEVYLQLKSAYEGLAEEASNRPASAGAPEREPARPAAPPTPSPTPAPSPPSSSASSRAPSPAPSKRAPRRRWPQRRPVTNQRTLEKRAEEEAEQRKRLLEEAKELLSSDVAGAVAAFRELASADPSVKYYRAWLHLALGREHEAAGDPRRARAEYMRALEAVPSFPNARRALDGLPPEQAGKKGLFSKLFGK